MLGVKLVTPHRPDCDAVASVDYGTWDSPWWLKTPASIQRRDARGGRRGTGYRWLTLSCADEKCGARLMVCMNDVEDAAERALREDEEE